MDISGDGACVFLPPFFPKLMRVKTPLKVVLLTRKSLILMQTFSSRSGGETSFGQGLYIPCGSGGLRCLTKFTLLSEASH